MNPIHLIWLEDYGFVIKIWQQKYSIPSDEEDIVRVQDDFQKKLMKNKAVIVSGYFNAILMDQFEYFNNAKALVDGLFVIVNNDHQRALKGSKKFQKEDERMIITNIKALEKAFLSIDKGLTGYTTLQMIAKKFGSQFELADANVRDQNNNTYSKRPACEEIGIALIDGHGNKIQYNSWLLKKTKE